MTRRPHPLPASRWRHVEYGFRWFAAILALLFATSAIAQESEFCTALGKVVAAGADRFRPVRTDAFDNTLETFGTTLQLPGMERCGVDAIGVAYFCMVRNLSAGQGDELVAELKQRIHACYPHAQAREGQDPLSPVPRSIIEWSLAGDRKIRIVRRTYADHPGSIYLYVR